MVFMNDERDAYDLQTFYEVVSRPEQTVVCVYGTGAMADMGFRQVSAELRAITKQTRYRYMLMENETQIFFTTRDRMRDGNFTLGRKNVTVIG